MLNRRGFFFSLSCASRGIFPPASVPFLWDCGPFLGRFFLGCSGLVLASAHLGGYTFANACLYGIVE